MLCSYWFVTQGLTNSAIWIITYSECRCSNCRRIRPEGDEEPSLESFVRGQVCCSAGRHISPPLPCSDGWVTKHLQKDGIGKLEHKRALHEISFNMKQTQNNARALAATCYGLTGAGLHRSCGRWDSSEPRGGGSATTAAAARGSAGLRSVPGAQSRML